MDMTQKIYVKLKKILKKLQNLKVIQSFHLKINFCQVEDSFKVNLLEIDSVLKKCLKKIGTKQRRAEIRKVITKLVRKKNLRDVGVQSENEDAHTFDGYLEIKSNPNENLISNPNLNLKIDAQPQNAQSLKEKRLKSIDCKQDLKKFQKFVCPHCNKVFPNFLEWKHHDGMEHFQSSFYKREESDKIFNLFESIEECKINENPNNYKNRVDSLKIPPNSDQSVIESSCRKGKNNVKKIAHSNILNNEKTLMNQEENTQIFTCALCDKVFKLFKSLKKHESIKHPVKSITYSCTTCEKSYVEKGKLNRHMLSHKSNQFQCSQCLKLFARSDALKRHLAIAHNSKRKWSCAFCQKKFSLKYNKDVHEENLHKNSDESLQCEHCGGKFKNKLTLRSHVIHIHSDKRITCSLCNKTFARKIHYKSHMKNKHFGVSLYQNLLDSVAKEDTCPTMLH